MNVSNGVFIMFLFFFSFLSMTIFISRFFFTVITFDSSPLWTLWKKVIVNKNRDYGLNIMRNSTIASHQESDYRHSCTARTSTVTRNPDNLLQKLCRNCQHPPFGQLFDKNLLFTKISKSFFNCNGKLFNSFNSSLTIEHICREICCLKKSSKIDPMIFRFYKKRVYVARKSFLQIIIYTHNNTYLLQITLCSDDSMLFIQFFAFNSIIYCSIKKYQRHCNFTVLLEKCFCNGIN